MAMIMNQPCANPFLASTPIPAYNKTAIVSIVQIGIIKIAKLLQQQVKTRMTKSKSVNTVMIS